MTSVDTLSSFTTVIKFVSKESKIFTTSSICFSQEIRFLLSSMTEDLIIKSHNPEIN